MQTPATKKLDQLGLKWIGHEYLHDPAVKDFGQEASRELGVDADRVFKTLIVKTEIGLVVGVLPVSQMLDVKALAMVCGAKKGEMADVSDAERSSGYVHGGISPVGQRKTLRTVIDGSAQSFPTIYVSGGRRGFDIEVAPEDLAAACGAQFAPIARR